MPIYDELYTHFRNRISNTENMGKSEVLYAFTAHESAKAGAAICQSSKIFNRLNPELTVQWEQIKRDLRINELLQDD